ncbi:MAG: DUF2807 domain-containing protein [Odoribacteraceae bacterium]|nr:DUF2807 domain-containing protein [Odoribacteraceae bacterium]
MNKSSSYLPCFFLVLPFMLVSCVLVVSTGTPGNKVIVTREIPVTGYSSLQVSVPGEIVYRQVTGDVPYCWVVTDENILSLLDIREEGGCLKIKVKRPGNIQPSRLTVETGSVRLDAVVLTGSGDVRLAGTVRGEGMAIRVTGSGDVTSEDLYGEKTDLSVTGSGNIRLKGKCDRLSCVVTGSGDIHVYDYLARDARCSVTGSGTVHARAGERLDAQVTGSGDIYYKGNPARVTRRVTGSGGIKGIHD